MSESTKRATLWILIALSLVPPFLVLSFPATITANSLALWLSASLGYSGIVLLLWMYILGARSVMGLVFDDLAPVLSIHKKLGKYGTLAIFAHPLLVTFSYGESLLYGLIPQLGTEFERHVTLGRISLLLIATTWFISWFLRGRMAFRPWKYLHYLAYIAVPFALLHVPDVGSQLISHTVVKAYFLSLVVVFFIFTILRLRGLLNLDKSPYTVASHRQLTPIDYALTLKPAVQTLVPRPGQYIYLKHGFISEDHPFTVADYDQATGAITIIYRIFGSYTRYLSEMQRGETVQIGGPYGSFMRDYGESSESAVFVAGGIGITPFVRFITADGTDREQWLFVANRSRELAVCVDALQPYLDQRLVTVYSDDVSSNRLTHESFQQHLTDPSRYRYYLCGPAAFMDAMRAELAQLGVPAARIETEKFSW